MVGIMINVTQYLFYFVTIPPLFHLTHVKINEGGIENDYFKALLLLFSLLD